MLRNNADARRCSYFELGLPVIKRTVVINSTTQHARHRKCEKLPPTIFSIFILKNVTWRTYLICFTVQYGFGQFSISFWLYRACFTHLISSNLSCNLCLWYFDQLVHLNKEINANVYRHSLWEYSKHFHCSFEWHLTPHMTLSIETCIWWTPCISGHYSIPPGCPLNTGFTVFSNQEFFFSL